MLQIFNMPPRLPTPVRANLLFKFRHMECDAADGKATAYALWKWTKTPTGNTLLQGVTPSKHAVISLLQRWEDAGRVDDAVLKDAPRSQAQRHDKHRPLSAATKKSILKAVNNSKSTDHERLSITISKQRHGNRIVTACAIRKFLRAEGFKYYRAQPTILLYPHHRAMRVAMAKRFGKHNVGRPFFRKQFHHDEKIFSIIPPIHRQNDGSWLSVKELSSEGMRRLQKVQERNVTCVNFWGGVGYNGKAKPYIFTENMTKEVFETILNECCFPFVLDPVNQVDIVVQDADPKHTAKRSKVLMTDNLGMDGFTEKPPTPCKECNTSGGPILQRRQVGGKWKYLKVNTKQQEDCKCFRRFVKAMPPNQYFHPAKSPDLNVMENVFAYMVAESKNVKTPPNSVDGLKKVLQRIWNKIPQNIIKNLFDSMPNRLENIVRNDGYMTGNWRKM
jgi:hypothetical protein